MGTLVYGDQCYQVIGACFEVYKEKGCGFLEAVYQECLEREFRIQSLSCEPSKEVALYYKGEPLRQTYKLDFLCFENIVLEIKAVSDLADPHRAQVLNYLAAGGFKLGLLVNFGHHPKVEWERIVK